MKKTLCVLLSLLLLLGMTSLAQADEAMTLRLWVRYDDDFSACIADFEALHPGVKIIQEQVGNNYDDLLAKYNTGMLANQLARLHFNVDCLHGDLSQAERNRIMQRFKAGEINVLVATDVAARGIDVSDVDAVINYDVPEENGRAKREGASYLFYTKDEQKRVDTLLRLTRNTDDCRSVHFDFNHEKLVVEEKQNVDKFNIKCYF